MVWFCCGLLLWQQTAVSDEDLESRIRLAEELNLTAPRDESQAIIDDLKRRFDEATPSQRARVTFLDARNRALAGDYLEGLNLLAPLRDMDLDAELRLKIIRLSANISLQLDEFEDSYRWLRQGLELIPEVEAARPRTNLLTLLAHFYGSAGEGPRGVEYGKRALEVARSEGSARDVCVAYHDLAVAQRRSGRLESALESRRQALHHCEAANDPVHIGVSRVSLGELLFEIKADTGAAEIIRAGIARLEEAGYRDGVLAGRLALAKVLHEQGDEEQAREMLVPLAAEFENLGLWRNASEARHLLARIAESRGRYREAYENQVAAESAGTRLLDRERTMRLAFLQVELDTHRKEQQIELLRERNRVLELRQESQRQRRYLALGGATAASVIGILLLLLLVRTRSDRRYLQWLSQHDGLTGLVNHTSFFRRANEALSVSRGEGQPFTLVVSDIDHFKAVNDEHGHAAGDSVLKRVGQALRDVFQPQGIVGRIGGEEFGIALPGVDRQRALELIAEFNARLGDVADHGPHAGITMSYGIGEIHGDQTVERLRVYADRALYEAKRRGRNQVVDANEVSDDPALKSGHNRRADDPR